MIANVGAIDRVARIVLGLGLLSMLIFVSGGWKWLGLIGLVPLFTALMGWCPAYGAMGVGTAGGKSRPTEQRR